MVFLKEKPDEKINFDHIDYYFPWNMKQLTTGIAYIPCIAYFEENMISTIYMTMQNTTMPISL